MQPANSYAHFDNFLALLQDYCPAVTGMAAFDGSAELLWCDRVGAFESGEIGYLRG